MEFNPLDHPIVLSQPAFISRHSAWVGHFPLAFLLIDLVRPRVLAELGTHFGDSYCAFCQAVQALGVTTRTFAVDTWRGDDQAGYYGDAVLNELRQYHDPRYGAFSTLLRLDFDEAAPRFDDGSIDLLHIDGHHTYDSVRHDFELWRPKMSERGVVLFHDTTERANPTFGVWKLWEELEKKYPSFNFHHGHGLGVLLVGAQPTAEMSAFIRSGNADPQRVRNFFEVMGQRMAALQGTLRQSHALLAAWEWLRSWREQTAQEPLPKLALADAMGNPPAMVHAVVTELRRVLEEDLRRRRQDQGQPPVETPPGTGGGGQR